MRNLIDLVEGAVLKGVTEGFEINGTAVYTKPGFAQLVGLCRKHGEMKGWVSTPNDDLTVWDAHHLTHMDIAAETGDIDPDDRHAELPGYAYTFTNEGVEPASEWEGHPHVEGNGLRITFNSDYSLSASAIRRLMSFMGEVKRGDWAD